MFIKRKIVDILRKYIQSPEAIVLTGFRRVGKTAVMRQIYEKLETGNKLFLDLESPVNQKIFQEENYENIKVALEKLGLDFSRPTSVFLDEIQYLRNLPSVVKYLFDHYRIKFYLTGSSSFYLKNLFSESLSGRKFIFELYPLDFEEFLWFKGLKLTTRAGFAQLSGHYDDYVQFGGFPAVVLKQSREEKLLALDDVLGSYFQLDVKNLANFRDNENLKQLLFLLSSRVGSKPEVGKLAESLGVTRQTILAYLDFFEQTYLISLLSPLSSSRDVQVRVQPKVYFIDTGILNRVAQIGRGQLLENKIFNQLFTRLVYEGHQTDLKPGIHYYQLKTGAEIDFIVAENTAYEVKVKASLFDVKKLQKTAQKIGITQFFEVSQDKIGSEDQRMIYPYEL